MKMTKKELTKAVARYARRHGFHVSDDVIYPGKEKETER
jgi:hypothetical protein